MVEETDNIDPIVLKLMELLPLAGLMGRFKNSAAKSKPKDGPDVLDVAPELSSDSEGLQVHVQKYKNVNGPEYVRKVGEVKVKEIDGDTITNEIFNEIGEFDLRAEQVPNKSKKTNIPY